MTTPQTPAQALAAVVALAEKATIGPWEVDAAVCGVHGTSTHAIYAREGITVHEVVEGGCECHDDPVNYMDAKFIAAACNFVRDHAQTLLSTLVAKETECERLRKVSELRQVAVDRWVPCPDHRDKTERGRCYVCENESLRRLAESAEAEAAGLRSLLAKVERTTVWVAPELPPRWDMLKWEHGEDRPAYIIRDPATVAAIDLALSGAPERQGGRGG